MQNFLPLERMSVADKLKAMEELWVDLSRSPAGYTSPLWHREILEVREADGDDYIDWDEAKRRLRGDSCE